MTILPEYAPNAELSDMAFRRARALRPLVWSRRVAFRCLFSARARAEREQARTDYWAAWFEGWNHHPTHYDPLTPR